MIATGILLYLVGWIVGGAMLAVSKKLESQTCELVSAAVVLLGMCLGALMVIAGVGIWAWRNLP